jgi:hypothetical protein
MEIEGKLVRLRPARIEDRRKIFAWLTQSDVTPSMMGPPTYPDHPLPSWKEFKGDYTTSFFNDDVNTSGKNHIILAGDTEVGTIGYDGLDPTAGCADLDLWMRAERRVARPKAGEAKLVPGEDVFSRSEQHTENDCNTCFAFRRLSYDAARLLSIFIASLITRDTAFSRPSAT